MGERGTAGRERHACKARLTRAKHDDEHYDRVTLQRDLADGYSSRCDGGGEWIYWE